jgi:hypothetical protein
VGYSGGFLEIRARFHLRGMKKKKSKSRMEMTHVDWITVYGVGSEKRGAELLKILRDKIGVNQNEKTYTGFGGGWFFETVH